MSIKSGKTQRHGPAADNRRRPALPLPPPDKQRPVLVLMRDSAIRLLSTVTVAPITSTVRGVPSEVVLDVEDGMRSGLRRFTLRAGLRLASFGQFDDFLIRFVNSQD